jgi:CubicO group peptidase (beta-lactamase class C family)
MAAHFDGGLGVTSLVTARLFPVLATVMLASPVSARLDVSSTVLCEAAVQEINESAQKTLAQGSPGMLVQVAQDGKVLFTGTYGLANLEHGAPVTRNTVFKLASITKQFTAAAILLLEQDGKLKVSDKLSRYVPELPQADKVTLYQLLVQTSGLPDYAEDPSGSKTKAVARTPEEMLAWIRKLTPSFLFQSGSRWGYSNSNYALLGLVAERVSQRPLSAFFKERLFVPAGLTSTAFDDPADVVPHRAQGYRAMKSQPVTFLNADWISPTIPGPGGGLRSTGDDLIRWNQALFSGRILQRETLKRMIAAGVLSDGRTTKLGMPEAWQKGLNSDYGMGFFIKPTIVGTRIGHSGDVDGFSTWAAHYPSKGVTIVHMINSQSADMATDAIEAAVFSGRRNEVCRS